MLELMERDPEQAVSLAVPFRWRQLLPPNVTRHFERWIDARGDFEVALAGGGASGKEVTYRWAVIAGQRYRAFVYGRRLGQPCQQRAPLHGIALADKVALTPEPIRFLDADEAQALERAPGQRQAETCAACGQPTGAAAQGWIGDIGGEIRRFCSEDHARLANQNLILAANDGPGVSAALAPGGSSAWTQGRKDVLYIRVNFPDDLTEPNSETAAYTAMDSVNSFYVANAYNQVWLSTTVTPLLTVPQVKAWYATAGPGALLDDARAVARKAGFDTDNYQFDIVSHTTVPGFDWGGLGALGGKGTWLQSAGAGVTAHELGHNFGVIHANFWNPFLAGTSIYGAGTNIEYGNVFDTMGAASAGNNQFNSCFKRDLDWLPAPAIHTVATNGVYRLYALDTALRTSGRQYAATVRKDFERDYWLEFRNRFTGNAALQNGVLLNWSPWSGSSGTDLLDATPATATLDDAALVIGRTFSDNLAGIHITPLARGTTGTNPWIDVRINLGDGGPNIPCCLHVEMTPTNPAPGQLVRFHVTVADRDDGAFAYAWTFDDGTFSTNNQPWIQKSWSQPGERVVRCEVSDMRGGRASANVIVPLGASTGFRVSGVVLDEQGNPLEDVLVNSGYTNANGPVIGFTDSDGRFVLTGVDGQIDLTAAKYGHVFEPAGWSNPLFVASDVFTANLLARALTNVNLTVSTNLLVESEGGSNQLTLSRSGGADEDLAVLVYLSGTADVPGDVAFTPPLVPGTNSIVIPAGSNRVVFSFTSVNNGMVEPAESVYLTLLEAQEYVLAAPAEARITVLDDDQSALPAVSVAALDGAVLENGMNRVGFVFARNGSTTGDLPVTYSVGGTATTGVDYATLLGTVIIPDGAASVVVELPVLDDKDVEPNETVVVTLNASPTYSIMTGSATATILDDDLLVVTVSPTGGGLAEPGGSGRFTVKRDGDQTANLMVHYTLTGSASNGVDYISPAGAVMIPAGQASAEVVITALDDAFLEGDESVTLVLTTNAAYDIGAPGAATLTLRDNEKVTVTVTATDDTASEPGSDFGVFTISRGSVVNGDLAVNLAINGTALAGFDYVPLENPVVIPDGSSQVSLALIPFDDLFWESPGETVIVTIRASTNYNLGTARQAMVTIADNDDFGSPAVGFTFTTFAAPENESPGLPVALSHTSSAPVTVHYQVIGGTASAADYTLAPGALTFEPGEWAKSIPLPIVNDSTVEPDETIRVTLYDPESATHDAIKIMTYTIQDDDVSSVSVAATAATASEAGPVAGNFRLTRTGDTNASLLVNFQITGTASALSDFPPVGSAVTIPAGATFADLAVTPVDDATVELDEEVTLTLIGAPGGKIAFPSTATITILDANTNSLPVVLLTSTNQPAAVEGGASGAFVLTRVGPTNDALTVFLTTTGTAASGADYVALPGSVAIPAGQTSVTLPVTAVDDSSIEGEETVLASLTVRDTYRVAHPGSARVMIQDNDQSVRVEASDFEAAEPGGSDPGEITFTRFGTTNTPLQVFYTVSGSAGNGTDYAAISNSITIPAGSLVAILPVMPLDDALVEGVESVMLTLQANAAYTLGAATTATVTIRDDEPMVSLVASRTNIVEGDQTPVTFTVRREGNPDHEFTARIAVAGTAGFGVDYPPFATNVFFSCGISAVDLSLFPTNELAVETEETVIVALLPDAAYTLLSPASAQVTVTDAGTNLAPAVLITSPTTNLVYLLPTNVNLILEALVVDDDTNAVTTVTWTNVSGPGALVFGATDQTNTTVSFTNSGVYVLRLTASDGQLSSFDEVTVVVGALARLTNNVANGGNELLHWTFDESSGVNVPDISGHARHGEIQGAAEWVTNGVLGGALNLAGTNNYIRAGADAGFLNGLTHFSFSCWIKPATVPSTRGLLVGDDSGLWPTLTLATRAVASCGAGTNVVEGTFVTSCDNARQISASDVLANDWQHLAVVWTNGLAPLLYINGQPDQPGRHKVPVRGELVNCPRFIVGRGPGDILETWAGLVDEVRVFPWAMQAAEVGTFVAANFGPIVEVPTNITVQVVTPVELTGTASDDARPVPPGAVTLAWSQVSGPVPVPLPDPAAATNTVTFTQSGDYVFRLVADDGQVKIYNDLPVTVLEPTQVYVYASDSEAAELGADPGQITIMRYGDLNLEMAIHFTLSGTASNGADYVPIQLTNSVLFPAGVDATNFIITPFLDHRTEGDETVVVTLVTNLIYTIVSPEATVTIHDSPYGVWNIGHFTLEELTDPLLSGEVADFDHDGLANFVEYAANRHPKTAETNAPLVTAVEFNPDDGLNHITLTYQRRILPTDVGYVVAISTNLPNWQTDAGLVEELSATPDANGETETVKARVKAPWPASMPQFVTVLVWLMSTGP